MRNKDLEDLLNGFEKITDDDYDGESDAFIHFSTRHTNLKMTVVGDPRDTTTIAAQQCVEVYGEFLESTGVTEEMPDQLNLKFMDTEGNA